MDHLDRLENQSIYIIREAFNKIERLAMLWSVGKDSQTIIWLARKAFFGHVPFPCVFMETSFDMPVWQSMLAVALSFLLVFVGCRVTGETDTNPSGTMGAGA